MEKTMKIQKLLAIQDRQYNDQQRPLACGTSE